MHANTTLSLQFFKNFNQEQHIKENFNYFLKQIHWYFASIYWVFFNHLKPASKCWRNFLYCVSKKKALQKYLHAKIDTKWVCVKKRNMAKIAQNYTNTRNSQYTQQSLFCNKIGIKIKGACVIFNQSLQSNLVIRNVLIRNFLQITSPFIPFCLFRTGFLQAVKIKFEKSKSS